MKYPVGTRFIRAGKNRREETVCDYHVTTNLAGKVVKERYVACHTFLGQRVEDRDVLELSISRGTILQIPNKSGAN